MSCVVGRRLGLWREQIGYFNLEDPCKVVETMQQHILTTGLDVRQGCP